MAQSCSPMDMKKAGFKAQELLKNGVRLPELKNVFSVKELHAEGFKVR